MRRRSKKVILSVLCLTVIFWIWSTRQRRHYDIVSYPLSDGVLEEVGTPIDIVFWTTIFGKVAYSNILAFSSVSCPPPRALNRDDSDEWCRVSSDLSKLSSAAALVFHQSDLDTGNLPTRRLAQPWVLYNQESPMNAPPLSLDEFRLFDWEMSYRLDADVTAPYYSSRELFHILSTLPQPSFSARRSYHLQKEAPVLWLASNCQSINGRESYVRELAKYIPIDSFGKCLKTGEYPLDETTGRPMNTVQLMRRYKFYLALENSNCKDYVSEKLFNALEAGTIPIVTGPPGRGASGYRFFVPNTSTLIHLDDYPDPRKLAALLIHLDRNQDEWMSYMNYRMSATMKPSSEFMTTWNATKTQLEWNFCGLCRKSMEAMDHARMTFQTHEHLPTRHASSLTPDQSCTPPGHLAKMIKNY